MQVVLSEDLERYVESEIAKGKFQSPEDVVSHALNRLKDEDQAYLDLKSEVQRRIALAEAGEVIEFDDESLQQMLDDIGAEVDAEIEETRLKTAT
ncbi:MAG: type II toxin-antitoxin system ParD family antitoxin [Planctomycetaceae bacterium]|nr:type II toxin-antitoxin system ParD family antitoxin [Planctomycetaceae bacterium]